MTERLPMICQLPGGDLDNTTDATRLQFLQRRFHLTPATARTMAPMVWEGAHG